MSELLKLDEGCSKYATEREREYLEDYLKTQNLRQTGRNFNVGESTIRRALKRVLKKATKRGWSPEHDMTHPAPEGFLVKGVSTYYGADGELKGQWVKTQIEKDHHYKMIMEAMSGIIEEVSGKSMIIPEPVDVMDNLLTNYVLAEPHVGMYSWALESGDDYDLDVATNLILGSMRRLVDSAPKSKECLIISVGDFFHSDSNLNVTSRSGHTLDVDTRWAKVMRVGVFIFREVINYALKKHDTVNIIVEIGNHDDYTSAMLVLVLEAYFKNNPRVKIDTSPAKFHYFRFGKCLIGTTHGDTVKPTELEGIMASDMAKDWGNTKFRYWYTGHIHHKTVHEFRGCTVESFNTIAAKDFYTASHGYRSKRNMVAIVMDREYGEVARHTVDISMIDQKLINSIRSGKIKTQKLL